MAFDAGTVRAISYELQNKLAGARVEKIHQPEKDEILFALHAGRENLRLTVSASANNPRIHLSTVQKENPASPPSFCILLRKHLSSAKLLSVEQIGFERVIRIAFEARDEMGFHYRVHLYAEIMGKYSNLILTDEQEIILGAIKPVDFTTSQKRQVLPGMRYELPPAQDKRDPMSEHKEGFLVLRAADEKAADKFITTHYAGISSLTAREIAYGTDSAESLYASFEQYIAKLSRNDYTPTLICDENGLPVEYACIDIDQYGNSYRKKHPESISEIIEQYFSARDNVDRVKQRAADLFKLLSNTQSRLEKKIGIQQEELAATSEKETFQKYGELITAHIYMLSKGMKFAEVTDYYSENMETIRIPMDVRLTPAQNAQRYYKKYTKLKNAQIELQKQIEVSTAELEYIRSVTDLLTRATGQTELDEIRAELSQAGYGARMKKTGGGQKKKPSRPIQYVTSGGYRVLCGKNNLQNDELSMKTAAKSDWWFHVKNAPGSHVVMLCDRDEPSEQDFTEAAMIAAVNSSLSEAKHIAVDYTQVRNLKKPSGAHPGFVIYHTNYSAYVSPNRDLVDKLKKTNE